MAARATRPDGEWLTVDETAAQLRVSSPTIGRMFRDGNLPGFRARSSIRIPVLFVSDALAAIRAGRSIDLSEFGRDWKARETTEALPARLAEATA